jgi:hypothetical protein
MADLADCLINLAAPRQIDLAVVIELVTQLPACRIDGILIALAVAGCIA